ncbi:IQ motif and SEC7 domain-containing protein 3-like protein [Willisornis vidua]|uniref:IQ motif and SEC7 domain-containing protein 3-like protein n=1 Tax=Willisornis vidua TaxID=1566151 RepID=A0ABQ9DHI2_9PASS|nr:IQ motif and SEC7 domain-containing protein 3-like protein [Willisornis vidua]
MESPAENPSKAAEYLKELNKIIETQQELLEKQKRRIDELEQQVAKLYHENACLQDEHHRHLATCRLQQGVPPAPPGVLSAIQENARHENLQILSGCTCQSSCLSSELSQPGNEVGMFASAQILA